MCLFALITADIILQGSLSGIATGVYITGEDLLGDTDETKKACEFFDTNQTYDSKVLYTILATIVVFHYDSFLLSCCVKVWLLGSLALAF